MRIHIITHITHAFSTQLIVGDKFIYHRRDKTRGKPGNEAREQAVKGAGSSPPSPQKTGWEASRKWGVGSAWLPQYSPVHGHNSAWRRSGSWISPSIQTETGHKIGLYYATLKYLL